MRTHQKGALVLRAGTGAFHGVGKKKKNICDVFTCIRFCPHIACAYLLSIQSCVRVESCPDHDPGAPWPHSLLCCQLSWLCSLPALTGMLEAVSWWRNAIERADAEMLSRLEGVHAGYPRASLGGPPNLSTSPPLHLSTLHPFPRKPHIPLNITRIFGRLQVLFVWF